MTGESSVATTAPAPPPPAATPSAPSPTPSSTPADTKPTSFADALAREDAAADSAPAQTSPQPFREPDAFQPAQATSEPAPGQEPPPVGEPPQERWPTILENARKKAREETTQQFQQQVQQLQPALQVIQKLNTDLPSTVGQLIREGLASPQHREGLRAELGRLFGSLKQQAQQQQPQAASPFADDVEPQRYVEIDGQQYFDPQADAKWQQWRERQLDKRYEEKFKPAMSLAERVQKAQQIAQFQQQSRQTVTERLDYWKDQPGFTEHKKAIGVKQQELYDKGLDEWTALGIAYAQVVPPLLTQQSQSSLTAQAVAKAAGRTDNPGAFASAPPRRPRTAKEALEQVGLL